jgi:hypothetical protein
MRSRHGLPCNRKSAGFTRLATEARNSVYPAISQNDNHRRRTSCPGRDAMRTTPPTAPHPGLGATGDQDNHSDGFGGISAPAPAARHGTGNEGVGEHVRTRFHLAKIAGEIADSRSAPNEENSFLLPNRFSLERTLSKMRSSRLT